MPVTLKGLGAIWGVGGATFTGIAIDSTTGRIQKLDFDKTSDNEQLMDENGEVAGEAYYNIKHEIDVTVIPSGASIAAARTNGSTMLPDPGAAITFVDADSTVTDSSNSGLYTVQSAKFGRTNKGFATIDLKVRQYKTTRTPDLTVTVA